MKPPGRARHRWENREVEWAVAHESMRATSEFQSEERDCRDTCVATPLRDVRVFDGRRSAPWLQLLASDMPASTASRGQETVQSRQDVERASRLRDRSSEHYERTN